MNDNNRNGRLTILDKSLPWDRMPGDRARELVALALVLLLCLLFMIIYWSTPLPERDRRADEQLPERLAKLVLEKKKEEPPPPPAEPEKPPEEEPEPEEKPKEEPEPEEKPRELEKARERAKKELKVFEDSLAGLRDIAPVVNDQPLRRGGNESTKIETSRNLITSRAGSSSGGIAVSSVSSGGGGGGKLEAGQVAQVESRINEEATTVRKSADGKSRRTDEQIRRVFDRYAGKFNSIYQRALRANPALEGTVVFELEIAPDGSVTGARIKSSELADPELERKMLVIARTMDFGALPVEAWKGEYGLNFFPR